MSSVPITGEFRKVHFNWPQRRSMIVRARIEVAVLARGVGKTERIIAPRMAHNAYAMPRSLGGMVTPSYKKLFTELVPSIYSGLDELGYIENRHYVIGKRGDSRWPQPYKRVRDWSHAMHWAVGSGRVFISQDRPGMGNGLSLTDMILEEAKLLDGPRFFGSVRQTIRGGIEHFGGKSEYQSILIVSDRPVTKKEKWFLVYKDGHDQQIIDLILQGAHRQQQLALSIQKGGLSERTVRDYQYQIEQLEVQLNELRCIATYWHEASALANIEVIGWDNFLEMERTMPPRLFASSIMNEEVDTIEGAWYPDMDDDHFYDPLTTSWTTERGFDRDRGASKDCRHDAEIVSHLPLDIGMDYGGRFNCMAVGQMFEDVFRIDNGFHCTSPERTVDVVNAFCRYYRTHATKLVYYYYDKTALDPHGASGHTYYQVVHDTLSKHEWNVVPVYIGQTPSPKRRYELSSSLLRQRPVAIQWNPHNCRDMITSMRMTEIKEGKNGMEKNKSAEGKVPLEEEVLNPHYSDAVDTLVWGRMHNTHTNGHAALPAFLR